MGWRQGGQIWRIGQLTCGEAAILLESRHCVGGETPLLALVEVSDLFGDGVPARRSTPFFPRCLIALLAVAGPVRDDLVGGAVVKGAGIGEDVLRSEEHTSELQSLMRISYAVFCLKKKKINQN